MPWSTSLIPTACPARETLRLIFLLYKQTRPQLGDHDRAVVERIVGFRDAAIRAAGSRVDLGRAFHAESFMRSFVIELLQESVELGLLLQDVGPRCTSGFLLQGEMHAFMTTVLLEITGLDPLISICLTAATKPRA